MSFELNGYTQGEAAALVAPIVGWRAEDVAQYAIVTLDETSHIGFGASDGIPPEQMPSVLRQAANIIELILAHEKGQR